MISTSRDMFVVCAITLLFLMSLSHSAPLDCKNLVKPLDQVDPRSFEGRWAMVATSVKIGGASLIPVDSIRIDFNNSTYTQVNRYGDQCHSMSEDISIEGPNFYSQAGQINQCTINGTLLNTSCSDCMVFFVVLETPKHIAVELCLFSRRREVDQNELKEFRAQVQCLNMPTPVVMDPTKELCPDMSLPSLDTEKKTEDPKA